MKNIINTGGSNWIGRQRIRIRLVVTAVVIMVVMVLVALILNLVMQNIAETSNGMQMITELNNHAVLLWLPFIIAGILFWGGILLTNDSPYRGSESYRKEGKIKIIFACLFIALMFGIAIYFATMTNRVSGSQSYTYGSGFLLTVFLGVPNVLLAVIALVQGIMCLRRAKN